MSTPGHVSDTVSAGQLRAFVERIERLEAEIKDLNSDKSDIYKELRGCGFDVKAVRQCVSARKLDGVEREERNALFDLYWSALHGSEPSVPRARAHARENIDEFPPHDPVTGEIESSHGMASDGMDPSADHVSPPASQAALGGGSANTENGNVDGGAERAGYGGQPMPLAGQIESRSSSEFVDGNASLAAREGEEVAALNSPSKADMILRIRPHCQHPGTERCGGQGKKHCHGCQQMADAAKQSEAA